jgi:hypothetical protein
MGGSRLLVQIAKRLFRILDCAVDVERSNIFVIRTADYVSETCNISQALEFSLVKHLFLDFQRFELFTPFQCPQQLFTGFVDLALVCAKELLEDE